MSSVVAILIPASRVSSLCIDIRFKANLKMLFLLTWSLGLILVPPPPIMSIRKTQDSFIIVLCGTPNGSIGLFLEL